MPERRARVGISGSYGGLNLGDEAILTVMLAQLHAALPVDVTVLSRNPEDTLRRHPHIVRAVKPGSLGRRQLVEFFAGLDLLILGGGGILYDADASTYLRDVLLAQEAGTPVMVHAVGVGPLKDPGTRKQVRDALNGVAAVTVRDRPSQRLLEDIGVEREVALTADPAVLLQPEPLTLDEILRAEALDPKARLIGFSVREPGPAAPTLDPQHYSALLANAADFMVDRLEAEVVFIPMERSMVDVQHSHGVVAQMRHAQCATVLKGEYSPGQLVSLLQHFEFGVGMRLHFLILCALAGLPLAGLPYGSKVSGFLEELELDAPALESVSAGQLIAHLDRAWDQRESVRAQVQRGLPALQARARQNTAMAAGLLRQGRGRASA